MPHSPDQTSELLNGDDFALWQAVALGASAIRKASTNAPLTHVQRIAWLTWVASGMVGTGGFYYCYSSADEMTEWAAAFDDLKLPHAADAIRKAIPLVRELQSRDGEGDTLNADLDRLERQFYDADEMTKERVAELIRQKPTEAFLGSISTGD